jgi:hypothetical protein
MGYLNAAPINKSNCLFKIYNSGKYEINESRFRKQVHDLSFQYNFSTLIHSEFKKKNLSNKYYLYSLGTLFQVLLFRLSY